MKGAHSKVTRAMIKERSQAAVRNKRLRAISQKGFEVGKSKLRFMSSKPPGLLRRIRPDALLVIEGADRPYSPGRVWKVTADDE